MEAVLTSFLAPFLPYLVKKGQALADAAIDKFGAVAWERAKGLWTKLRPAVNDDPTARDAADAIADDPEDEAARGALQFQLRSVLQARPELHAELERIVRQAQQDAVMASDGAVIIHGDVKADRGGVAAGRDVHGGSGGIHIGQGDRDQEAHERW